MLLYMSHAVACDIKHHTHCVSLLLLTLAHPDIPDLMHETVLQLAGSFACNIFSLLAAEGVGGVSTAAAVSGGLHGQPAPHCPAVRPALSH